MRAYSDVHDLSSTLEEKKTHAERGNLNPGFKILLVNMLLVLRLRVHLLLVRKLLVHILLVHMLLLILYL